LIWHSLPAPSIDDTFIPEHTNLRQRHAQHGLPTAADTAMAKVLCNRAGFQAANESMQIMGGAGYDQGNLVEYCFRRTRGWMIAGGSIEILQNRVAESVFERSFSQRAPKAK
jgi:alkylation response protein AidB-like acyl-CoA dehydrogenase